MTSVARRQPIDWARFLGSTAFLAGAVALSVLAVATAAWVRSPDAFFLQNQTAKFIRRDLLVSVLVAGVIPVLLAVVSVAVFRARGADAVHRMARLAAPLAVLWAVVALSAYRIWRTHPLEFLCLLALSVLALEQTLRHSLAATPGFLLTRAGELYDRLPGVVRRALPWTVVLAGASGYAAYMGYYSVQQHQRLATSSFDLGIYDNLMYGILAGHPFRSPVLFGAEGGNYIAGHAEFVMVLFAPLYALVPRAETLLVLQSFMLGFAAVPLYAFAKTQLPRWSAVLVSLAYLLFAPLHGPNFYDFHWLPITIPFVFALFWAIATRRNVLTWIFFFILVSVREDVPIGLALLGIFLIVSGARVLLGSAMTLLAGIMFVLIKFVIMPAAGDWWFENLYKDLIPPGYGGYSPIVQTILINPAYFIQTLLEKEKLVYALHLFAPLAFLPARNWKILLGASAGFFFTLMTTDYGPTLNIAFQYGCHWIPYLFGASVLMLRLIGRQEQGVVRRRAALLALCAGVFLHSLTFGAILQRSHFVGGFSKIPFAITSAERARYADLRAIVAMIPKRASVAATDAETPHISNRLNAYALRERPDIVDYVLIRKALLDFGSSRKHTQGLFQRASYGLLAKRGEFYLFQRGHTSEETAKALAELGLPGGAR